MNYLNTIIYKIVCKDVEITECYVGHTTNFSQRKTAHSASCRNIGDSSFNRYVYQFIREHNGWKNWNMVEVEKYNAIDKLDAEKRERYWIETLEAKLNKIIPTRTQDEWYEKNKEIINCKKRHYYQQNKEQICLEKQKYNETHKEQIKEYREKNKDKIKETKKIWYQKNRDKILTQKKLKKETQA